MTIKTSGSLSITDIANEFNSGTVLPLGSFYRNGGKVPDLTVNQAIPLNGAIGIGHFYGASLTNPPAGTYGTAEYSSPGTYNLTIPSSSGNIEIFAIGAGGGGGGAGEPGTTAGGGGGAGGWELITIPVVNGIYNLTIVIGSGGSPGLGEVKNQVGQSNGGQGGSTTVIYNGVSYTVGGGYGGYCTAAGRGGGPGGTGGNGGANGNAGSPVTSSDGGAGAASAYNTYINGSIATSGAPGYYNSSWVGGNGALGGGGGGGSGSHNSRRYYNGGAGGNGYARIRY